MCYVRTHVRPIPQIYVHVSHRDHLCYTLQCSDSASVTCLWAQTPIRCIEALPFDDLPQPCKCHPIDKMCTMHQVRVSCCRSLAGCVAGSAAENRYNFEKHKKTRNKYPSDIFPTTQNEKRFSLVSSNKAAFDLPAAAAIG